MLGEAADAPDGLTPTECAHIMPESTNTGLDLENKVLYAVLFHLPIH